MIVCSDHSQSLVEDEIDLFRAFEDIPVLPASGVRERKDGATPGSRCAPAPARRRCTCWTATTARSS